MKVVVGGSCAEQWEDFLDSLVERWIVTDIWDEHNPPEEADASMFFSRSLDEVSDILSNMRDWVTANFPVFVFWPEPEWVETPSNVFFFSGSLDPDSSELMEAIRWAVHGRLSPDLTKVEAKVSIDVEKKRLIYSEGVIGFTQSEFDVLMKLLSKPGNVFSKDEIRSWIVDSQSEDIKMIGVYIHKIRKKIEPIEGLEIETIRWRWYSVLVTNEVILEWEQVEHVDEFSFDPMRGRLFAEYEEITRFDLTVTETKIMEILVRHPGRTYTKEFLFAQLYDYWEWASQDTKIIDVFICKIRDRLWIHRDCIETHWWEWYSFNEEAYRSLVKSKRDFSNAPQITGDTPTWSNVDELLGKQYENDWLMYVKTVSDDEDEGVKALARIYYSASANSINIEIFDASWFRSISPKGAQEFFTDNKIEQFDDFYDGIRGFMEVRNQDALYGENTWEHILKVFSRSSYWEGRIFRGYCSELDKSIEMTRSGESIHVSVCDKDYYAAFESTPIIEVWRIFIGKRLKKMAAPTSGKPHHSRGKPKQAVKVLTAEGMVEQKQARTSSRFLEELNAASSIHEKLKIFQTNKTPNLKIYFKTRVTKHRKPLSRVAQYSIAFIRVGTTDEVRIKLYDGWSRKLYAVNTVELEKILGSTQIETFNPQINIKKVFQDKWISLDGEKSDKKTEKSQWNELEKFSLEKLKEQVAVFEEEKKTGILLTIFSKNHAGTPVTITVLSFGRGIEYRVDAGSNSNTYSSFQELEAYCSEAQLWDLKLKVT